MRIAVVGLWHLGCVYAASLASLNHSVTAVDRDLEVVSALAAGTPPVAEPGLAELISEGLRTCTLNFSHELTAIREAEVVWLTIDTPVREDDSADVSVVLETATEIVSEMSPSAVLVISSQLPLGTSRRIWHQIRTDRPGTSIEVAYSPENLRLGSALNSFRNARRFVVGGSAPSAVIAVQQAFEPLGVDVLTMSLESAELSKHALNTFLAMSVAFANEIGRLAEASHADAWEVAAALKSDPRIGQRSYLTPGGPIAGGTLARDVNYLTEIGLTNGIQIPVISSILESNGIQFSWAIEALRELMDPGEGSVLILGLAYKAGTSTLRRSYGLTMARMVADSGYRVLVYDTLAETLPHDASDLERTGDLRSALGLVNCVIICANEESVTRLPYLLDQAPSRPYVIDAVGALTGATLLPNSLTIKTPGKGMV